MHMYRDSTDPAQSLRALDLQGVSRPRRVRPQDALGRESRQLADVSDHLLVEGATVRYRPYTASPSHPALAPQPYPPPMTTGTEQIWHSHVQPHSHTILRDTMCLEGSVYLACVQLDSPPRGAAPQQLQVTKLSPYCLDDAIELSELINRKLPIDTFMANHRAVPNALRDAYFGRLAGAVSHARRIALAPAGVLSQHPLFDGDLHHLLEPLAGVEDTLCEQFCIHFTFEMLAQLAQLQKCKIVHGDIKPENIVFWRDASFTLNDFSSAYGLWEERMICLPPTTAAYQAFDDDIEAMSSSSTYCSTDSDLSSCSVLRWPHGKDLYSMGVTLLFLASGIQPFNLPEGPIDHDDIFARQDLWRRAYGDIETFCCSSDAHPHLRPENVGEGQDDRERASALADAFAGMRKRAPSLVWAVSQMLHPNIDERPQAHSLLRDLAHLQPKRQPAAAAVRAWLEALPQGEIDHAIGRLTDFAPEPSLGRPRRNSLPGPAILGPWDEERLSGPRSLSRTWCREAWSKSQNALWRSRLHPHVTDEMLEAADLQMSQQNDF